MRKKTMDTEVLEEILLTEVVGILGMVLELDLRLDGMSMVEGMEIETLAIKKEMESTKL